jgi:tetratricopeptide (TPR) repeat protein
MGQYQKAVDSYEKLIRLDSDNGYYHRLTANALITAKNQAKAAMHLNIALALNDMDMESYNMLAKLYFNTGDFNKASETANAGLTKNMRNVDLLFINARVAFMTKNYEKVIGYGNAALRINADTSRWNLYLGYCSYYMDNYADCILWLNTAINDKSISEQGYTYLANSYLKTGNNIKAHECFDKAIVMAKDDNLGSNLQNKAILLHDEKKDSEAIRLLEDAYHIDKNPQILFRLSQMHYNKKQYSSARSYLNQYQKSKDTLYQKEAISLKEKIKEAEKRP